MLQAILSRGPDLPAYQRSGCRQTEYQRPRFSSRQCGSLQFFSTIAADSVAPGSATGALEQAESQQQTERKMAARTQIANLIGAPPCVDTERSPTRFDVRGGG